jgi:transposase InsO family protein
MRFAAVKRLVGHHPVARVCRLLGVSCSGYHRWNRATPSQRLLEDRLLKQQILEEHAASRGRYGTPRIERSLRRKGVRTSRKRVARLRREMTLRAKAARRFRVTTKSDPAHPIAPNLLERRFEAAAADRIWLGDITYLQTDEGWLYLAAILDTYSRRIVGWTTSESLDRDFVVEALDRALAARRPDEGLLHHSDRGCQYTSGEYRDRLADAGVVVSMSRAGDCWDNAMMESFFKTLKTELGDRFTSRDEARRELFDYIEGFYNTRRLHSRLGYLSPAEFERLADHVEAAA